MAESQRYPRADDDPVVTTHELSSPPVSHEPTPKLRVLRFFQHAVVILLLVQAFRLQVSSGSLFRREAEGNRVRELTEYAPRGIFLDRFGVPLVQNVPSIELVSEPALLPDDLEGLFTQLREALPDRDLTDIRARLQGVDRSGQETVPLLLNLSQKEYLALSARADRLHGLRVETRAVRSYDRSDAFAHVLGYTGKISAEERTRLPSYALTDIIGKSGLERQYEELLRGQDGVRRVEVDARGLTQHDLGRVVPRPGMNLRLHLDADLQKTAAEALQLGLQQAGARKGAVVALDPFSGAVRALVSLPVYPHTDFASGARDKTVRRALDASDAPLLNRTVQGEYVPGSTFKLVAAAGALEEKMITPATTVDSSGGIRVGVWFFPDWKPGGHGRTNLAKALAESVNTFFYTVVGGADTVPGLGIERLMAWARRLGAGSRTGIDLPEEADGFLPSPAWKEQVKKEQWYIGDTYHAAIGQGDVLLTPVQLAVMTAALANGGTVFAPRLLEASVDPNGTIRERIPPETRAEGVLRAESTQAIRAGMRLAVTDGSARGLLGLPVTTEAKTGTAQLGGTERTHAWVTVIAPAEKPELVLTVLLEHAGGGDRHAVPVARSILERYFTRQPRGARSSSLREGLDSGFRRGRLSSRNQKTLAHCVDLC